MTRLVLVAAGVLAVAAGAMPTSFTIRSVAVERDGQWHDDPNGHQTRRQCAAFRLPAATARAWFRNAREVTKQDWLERLDWTQCSAAGTLVTGDGRTYRWELDQSGRGRVIVTPDVSVYLAGRGLGSAAGVGRGS